MVDHLSADITEHPYSWDDVHYAINAYRKEHYQLYNNLQPSPEDQTVYRVISCRSPHHEDDQNHSLSR